MQSFLVLEVRGQSQICPFCFKCRTNKGTLSCKIVKMWRVVFKLWEIWPFRGIEMWTLWLVIIIILLTNAKVAFSCAKYVVKVSLRHKGAQSQVHLMFMRAFLNVSLGRCLQIKILVSWDQYLSISWLDFQQNAAISRQQLVSAVNGYYGDAQKLHIKEPFTFYVNFTRKWDYYIKTA